MFLDVKKPKKNSPRALCHGPAGGLTVPPIPPRLPAALFSICVFYAHIIWVPSCLLKNEKSYEAK